MLFPFFFFFKVSGHKIKGGKSTKVNVDYSKRCLNVLALLSVNPLLNVLNVRNNTLLNHQVQRKCLKITVCSKLESTCYFLFPELRQSVFLLPCLP